MPLCNNLSSDRGAAGVSGVNGKHGSFQSESPKVSRISPGRRGAAHGYSSHFFNSSPPVSHDDGEVLAMKPIHEKPGNTPAYTNRR